jgi:hypothetical protein
MMISILCGVTMESIRYDGFVELSFLIIQALGFLILHVMMLWSCDFGWVDPPLVRSFFFANGMENVSMESVDLFFRIIFRQRWH